ncbi:type II restriction endonuclease [Ferruginibacter profundus]
MNSGYLSTYFEVVIAKTLSAVEANRSSSNQHEFNGTKQLKRVIRTTETAQFPTKFIWMGEENEAVAADSTVSWYDARKGNPNRSAEFRLYFQNNPAIELAKEGDTMFIARRTDDTLLIIITPPGSTIERQLYWLFNLSSPQGNLFSVSEIDFASNMEIDFSARFILEELGIEVEEPENDVIDRLLEKFVGAFPTTAEFSAYARETITEKYSIHEDPDHALMSLLLWEEKLFRRLERYNVSLRLKDGFKTEDVDGFLNFSLSVQNRRKSRAGAALEDHVNFIFQKAGIHFSKGQKTENKAKPDFIFPNITLYHDKEFPSNLLTMLGAKTSLKDRWRQVLSEAERISLKHLLTLEPGISENQTDEMKAKNLQLVLPKEIHQTFTNKQKDWLITFKDFISIVKEKQIRSFS